MDGKESLCLAAALELVEKNLPLTICKGKKPHGDGWQRAKWSADDVEAAFAADSSWNVGLRLGPSSRIIDIETDSADGELDCAALFEGCDAPVSPTFQSKRGRHRLFRWHPRLGQVGKAVLKWKGVEVRCGANGLGAHSLIPPSETDGFTRRWLVGLDDADPPELPAKVIDRLLTGAEANGSSKKTDWDATAAGVKQGGRHQAALSLIGKLVRNILDLHDTESLRIQWQAVLAWNERNQPPIERAELQAVFQDILNRERAKRGSEETATAQEPTWPDPPNAVAYAGIAGEFVKTIEPHSEADPAGLLVQTLTAFGSVIGRTAHFRAEADRHYCNLFVALVGASGSGGRKGSGAGRVLSVFQPIDPHWHSERIASGLSSGEGLIWAVRDPITKTEPVREGKARLVTGHQEIVSDLGVDDKRLLAFEPELARLLRVAKRDGNIVSAVIRQAWDNGDLRTLTKNNPATATGAHISLIGHVTQDELLRNLNETECANGFANRFLWVAVRRSKCLPSGGSLDGMALQPVVEAFGKAVAFAKGVGEISRDAEAETVWHKVYAELSAGRPGLVGSILGRAEAQTMRLATTYALLDLSTAIRRKHLISALALWEYCEASARFIFGDALGDPTADEILRALKNAGDEGLTRTQISSLFGRHKTANEISRALGVLLQANLAAPRVVETEGRPVEKWTAKT